MTTIKCSKCKRIIQENLYGLKQNKFYQCPYCGEMLSNPFYDKDEEGEVSYIR